MLFISFITEQTTEDLEQPLKFEGVNDQGLWKMTRGKGKGSKENILTLQKEIGRYHWIWNKK